MSLDWPPLKMPRLAPPKSFKYENHIEVLRHLRLFRSYGGGQSGTLSFFSKSVTYRPTLSKFKGGPIKKHPADGDKNKKVDEEEGKKREDWDHYVVEEDRKLWNV